jgi:MinD superfamily P-loop ATPase
MTSTVRGPWLVAFTGEPEGRCPKCLTQHPITEYHDTVVAGMCKERRDAIVAMAEYPEYVPDETTEHLCRGCHACGFTWSENVASPADLERVKAAAVDEY